MTSHLPRYRVLLVDDVPVVREALRYALEDERDLMVVGEADDGVEALRRTAELTPDVVILDVALPRLDGFAVTRALKAAVRPPVVVVLTGHSDPRSRQRSAEAGGDGFAEKSAGWPALIAEVRRALGGHPGARAAATPAPDAARALLCGPGTPAVVKHPPYP